MATRLKKKNSVLKPNKGIDGNKPISLNSMLLQNASGNEFIANFSQDTQSNIYEQLDKLNAEINNSILQVNALGISQRQFEEETDNRNQLYKLLGFKQDVPLALNLLDLLDRPANAVRGMFIGYDASGNYNPAQASFDGLVGRKEYGVMELLKQTGIDISSWPVLFRLPLTIGYSMVLDPLTYANAPINFLTQKLKQASINLTKNTKTFFGTLFSHEEWYKEVTNFFSDMSGKFKDAFNLYKQKSARLLQKAINEFEPLRNIFGEYNSHYVVSLDELFKKKSAASFHNAYVLSFEKSTSQNQWKYLKDLQDVLPSYSFIETPEQLRDGYVVAREIVEQSPHWQSRLSQLEKVTIKETGETGYRIFKGLKNFNDKDWAKLAKEWVSAIAAKGTKNIPISLIYQSWQDDVNIVQFVNQQWNKPINSETDLVEVLKAMGYEIDIDAVSNQLVVKGSDPLTYHETPHGIINVLNDNTFVVDSTKYNYYAFYRDMGLDTPEGSVLIEAVLNQLSIQSGKPLEELYRNMIIYVPKLHLNNNYITLDGLNIKLIKEDIKAKKNIITFNEEIAKNITKGLNYKVKYQTEGVANIEVINKLSSNEYKTQVPFNNVDEFKFYIENEQYKFDTLDITKKDAFHIHKLKEAQKKLLTKLNKKRTRIYANQPKTRRDFRRMFNFKAVPDRLGISVSTNEHLLYKFSVGDDTYKVGLRAFESNKPIAELGTNAKDIAVVQAVLTKPDGTKQVLGYKLAVFTDSNKAYKQVVQSASKQLKASEYENLTIFLNKVETLAKANNNNATDVLFDEYKNFLVEKLEKSSTEKELNEMFIDMTGLYGTEYGLKQTAFELALWDDLELASQIKNHLATNLDEANLIKLNNLTKNFKTLKTQKWNETFNKIVITPFLKENENFLNKFLDNSIKSITEGKPNAGFILLFNNAKLGDDITRAANALNFQTKLMSIYNGTEIATRLQTLLDYQYFIYKPTPKNNFIKITLNNFLDNEQAFIEKINTLSQNMFEALKTRVLFLDRDNFSDDLIKSVKQGKPNTLSPEEIDSMMEKIKIGINEIDNHAKQRNIINPYIDKNSGDVTLVVDMAAYSDLMEVIGRSNNIDLRKSKADYFTKLQTAAQDPSVSIKLKVDDDTLAKSFNDIFELVSTNIVANAERIEAAYAREIRRQNIANIADLMRLESDKIVKHNTKVKGTNYQTKDARIWTKAPKQIGSENVINFHTWSFVYEALNRYKNINLNTRMLADAVGDPNILKHWKDYGDLHLPNYLDQEYILQKNLDNFAKTPQTARNIIDSYVGNLEKKLATKSYIGSTTDLNAWAGAELFDTAHYRALAAQFGYTSEAFKRFNLLETSIQNELIKPISDLEVFNWTNELRIKNKTAPYQSVTEIKLPDLEAFAKNYKGYTNEYQFIDTDTLNYLQKNLDLYKAIAGREYGIDNVKEWVKKLGEMLENGERILMHRAPLNFLNATLKNQVSLIKNTNSFWNFIDKYVVRPFKKISTFSVGFHLRNIIGNYTNAWLAGVSPTDLSKFKKQSIEEYNNIRRVWEKALHKLTTDSRFNQAFSLTELKESIKAILDTPQEQAYFDLGFKYFSLGLMNTRFNDDIMNQYTQIVHSLKSKTKLNPQQARKWFKSVNDVFEKSKKFSEAIDAVDKIALYHFAKTPKGQKLIKDYGLNQPVTTSPINAQQIIRNDSEIAADFANFVFFDYNDLSPFERSFLQKAFPFYTWMRKNFEFHLKNFAKNSKRYSKLLQFYNGWNQAFIDDPDKEQAYLKYSKIPIWDHGDGRITYINSPLTILNITQVATGTDVVNALNPLFKWPVEQITGISLFTGQPKDNWKYLPFGFDYLFTIPQYIVDKVQNDPNLTRPQAAELGLLGSRLLNFADAATNWLTIGDPNFNPLLFFPSFFSEYDTNKVMLNNRLRYARKLNDYLNALRQSGKYVPTIQEILPNKYGAINPKYQRLSPRYTYKQLMKLVRYEHQKNYKR